MSPSTRLLRIVSGGQTGVDRAALDAARLVGIESGGWCPRGRRAEDGPIPSEYALRETDSSDYAQRTEQNVIDSDGTLIIHRGPIRGGTELTVRLARMHRRPHLEIDVDQTEFEWVFADWIDRESIQVMNVAGPRESSSPGIGEQACRLLVQLLRPYTANAAEG